MILVALATAAASLAALAAWLAAGDPKRRTAFRLPPAPGRRPGLGWTAVLLPGVAAAWLGGGGAFLVWFGTVTVVGWSVAALRPEAAERARLAVAAVAAGAVAFVERVAGLVRVVGAGAARLAAARRVARARRSRTGSPSSRPASRPSRPNSPPSAARKRRRSRPTPSSSNSLVPPAADGR